MKGPGVGHQPSSPQIGLFKDGRLVHMLERHDIEGRAPEAIAADPEAAFEQSCMPARRGRS